MQSPNSSHTLFGDDGGKGRLTPSISRVPLNLSSAKSDFLAKYSFTNNKIINLSFSYFISFDSVETSSKNNKSAILFSFLSQSSELFFCKSEDKMFSLLCTNFFSPHYLEQKNKKTKTNQTNETNVKNEKNASNNMMLPTNATSELITTCRKSTIKPQHESVLSSSFFLKLFTEKFLLLF
jgi:hypothetical protein